MSSTNWLTQCQFGVVVFPVMTTSHLFKIIRLHCRDFSNIFTNKQLCERMAIRSLNSLRILADCNMLYRLITYPMNTEITLRLIQQSTFSACYPNRLIFFYFSSKSVWRSSFINRSKAILNLIPFEWHQMSMHRFKKNMKIVTPIYFYWWTCFNNVPIMF